MEQVGTGVFDYKHGSKQLTKSGKERRTWRKVGVCIENEWREIHTNGKEALIGEGEGRRERRNAVERQRSNDSHPVNGAPFLYPKVQHSFDDPFGAEKKMQVLQNTVQERGSCDG